MSEKIGKFEISELLELSKKTPHSALVLAHGEGLIEGIERIKQRLAEKDIEIMRLREALNAMRDTFDVGGVVTSEENNALHKADKALSNPTTYDNLMAWHEAQFGEPMAWMIWWDDREWLFTGDREDFDDATKSKFPITPLYAKKG